MSTKHGKIVVANDEWTLSDAGFDHASDAGTYASNVATWFTGGQPGRFLVYSDDFGVTQSRLHDTLTSAGHTLVAQADFSQPFTADSLASFDAVFLTRESADNQALIEYVEAGGCVYLAAGTGSDATAEAAKWTTFLNHFDLGLAPAYNHISGNQTIASEHPIFQGVTALYEDNGNNVELTVPDSAISQLITDGQGRGLYAMTDLANRPRHGKIVVANDEWTLSDAGFKAASDTGTYASNVASWFTGGQPGRFLVYSTDFGLTQSRLHDTLTSAGHTLVAKADFSQPFTADSLASFNAVFLAQDSADNQVLIEYLEAGGCVYLAAGTGPDAAAEAARWAAFLNHFDLGLASSYNQISGNQAIASEHPIFQGVTALYENNGNNVELTVPDSAISQLITDGQGRGLYAMTDLANRPPLSSTLSFQHVWAGSARDLAGSVDLEAVGSPTAGASVSGLANTLYTRAALEFPELSKDAWQAPDTGFANLAGESAIIVGLFQTPSTQADTYETGLVGKRESGTTDGWEIGLDGRGRVLAMLHANGTLCALNVAGDARDTKWHTFVLVYAKSTGKVTLHTESGSSAEGVIPGDCTSTVAMSIGANRFRSAGARIGFVAMAMGPNVESVDGSALAASLHEQYVAS